MNWIELNNQVIIKDKEGKYQLEKDKEALNSYIKEYVTPRLLRFENIEEKLKYLVDNNYYSENVINKYNMSFIKKVYDLIESNNFKFQSYMSANKF